MMTTETLKQADGRLQGPWRTPFNIAAEAEGSIHNDETARQFGLEGGWIAGSIHMEQFVPLFIERFGLAWLERGGFSVYFKHATLSGQKVRATVYDVCEETRASKFAMHDGENRIVCEGEAWLGERPTETTLRSRMQRFADSEVGPLLNTISTDLEVTDVPSIIPESRLDKDRRNVTERIPSYDTGVLPPNLAIDTLRAVEPVLLRLPDDVVGLYGGIELQMIDGPICAQTQYSASGKILELGQTPRTEVLFYGAQLHHQDALIAKMIMMSRVMGNPDS